MNFPFFYLQCDIIIRNNTGKFFADMAQFNSVLFRQSEPSFIYNYLQ